MKALMIILSIVMLCLAATATAAVTGPQTVNGRQYYVVYGDDPAQDTGNEVCARAGLGCVGYTEPTAAACRAFHPGAAGVSGVSGDKAGTYCDGAPQSGICAGLADTCLTCPSCTNTVTCSQRIGGLYKEMYVECGNAASCSVTVASQDTNAFLTEIPSINAQLQGCQRPLPSGTGLVLADGNTIVDITRTAGGTSSFTLVKKKGAFTGITSGAASVCTQRVTISEQDFDSILASSDRGAQAAYLLKQKRITVNGCNFLSGVRLFFTRPIARLVAGRTAPTAPAPTPAPNCGNIGEQCNNRGCFSGMCGAPKENVNGQWRYVNYRCIDQRDYTNYCLGHGNTGPAWQCLVGPCG